MASVGNINTITLPDGNTYDIRDTNAVPMTGATSSAAGASGLVPAPTSSDSTKFLRGDGTWGDGGMPMVILSYGNSTWSDFINAYNNNVIVYCRASSNANPATGSQTRMAFMAYVNNATSPTEVEFQYYRSVSSHTASQQGDQVFVYKLTSASKWTVTTREAMARIVAGTNMSSTYSNNVLTINGNYSAMTGASSSAAGATGLVPAPATGDNEKFLRGDGTWAEAGGTVDSDLSASSTNPVQNSTITNALTSIDGRLTQTESNKADKTDTVLLTTLSRGRKANSTVGTGSLAFGDDVTASGSYTHAEGNLTSASGAYTHAEGIGSEASSRGSHAEGFGASATAYYAHAEGCGTTAKSKSQHVAGEYNVLDPTGGTSVTGTYVEIVGNGTGHGNRSNARALDWNGNEYLMGDIYVKCGANSTGGMKVSTVFPEVGEIKMFSGATPPSKWKLCDGSVISREDYGDLFTAIGTTYGGGDGSTTFAIPDFKGRSPVGVGESAATGHTAHTLGQYAGEESHVLIVDELASHSHTLTSKASEYYSGADCPLGGHYNTRTSGGYVSGTTATGSNTAHNTMQPYTGINFIIYTGTE